MTESYRMSPATPTSPIIFYLKLMEEIKIRIDYINRVMSRDTILPLKFKREFCLLQLRMIFELIALACISIYSKHVDIGRLEKEWNAKEIMPRLTKLNPEFFPRAVIITALPDRVDCQDAEPAPMTKEEFIGLYGRCGAQLHRGTLREMLKPHPGKFSYSDIRYTLVAIVNLLNTHRIPSPDFQTHYICNMINGPEGPDTMVIAEIQ
jgi:hypothetical protein